MIILGKVRPLSRHLIEAYTRVSIIAHPMQLVGRPKLARPLPKVIPRTAVQALLETVARDEGSKRQTEWAERDLALILSNNIFRRIVSVSASGLVSRLAGVAKRLGYSVI
jgi:hypothetical protein